ILHQHLAAKNHVIDCCVIGYGWRCLSVFHVKPRWSRCEVWFHVKLPLSWFRGSTYLWLVSLLLLPISPSRSIVARIIAIANQKGGVGKTTTAVNLAASLAIAERRTLLIDGDPQGNATSGVGIDKAGVARSLYDVLIDGVPVRDVVVPDEQLPYLHVIPATQDLVGAELELVGSENREGRLRSALVAVRDDYDYVLIDCPPSL